MAGFREASTLVKVSFICFLLGLLLFLIGFSTDYWSSWYGYDYYRHYVRVHTGLWSATGSRAPDFWKATQAMECLGLIAAIVTLIMFILYLFIHPYAGTRKYAMYAALAAFITGGFVLIGIIIFGAKIGNSDNLGWSYWLETISGVVFVVVGALLIFDKK